MADALARGRDVRLTRVSAPTARTAGARVPARMDVTVFGATGKIGHLVVEQLLEAGHHVRALVRSPGKLTVEDDHLEVIVAELDDAPAIRKAVDGADAVISALGPAIDPFLRSGPLTEATRTIVAAMHESGVRRLIALATVSVPDPRDRPGLDRPARARRRSACSSPARCARSRGSARSSPPPSWTGRSPGSPRPSTSRPTAPCAPGSSAATSGRPMARTDVAAFLVDQLTDDRFVGASPAISN